MWDYLEKRVIEPFAKIDYENSFYCGQNGGRPPIKRKMRPDFNNHDYLFAKRVGVRYETPGSFFVGESLESVNKITYVNG
jgi:hypothetical protein